MNIPWLDFLATQGAVAADGRVLHFGRPQAELAAAGNSDIIVDLSQLGLLQVGGDDAVAFLQGQVTNDIKLLDGSNSQYAGYCTAKGRLLAIFLAFAHHDHLHLQLDGALSEQIMKRLKMYVLRSKVSIEDVSDSIIRIGVAGTGTTAALQALFTDLPQHAHQLASLETATIIRLPGATVRYEILTSAQHAAALWTQLSRTCTPVGSACWDWLEIRAGIAQVGPATQEQFVPQMVNLDLLEGINFKKGCYTGQEIVARTHYLGKVKRRAHLAHVDAPQPPKAGDPVFGNAAEPVGMVVNAAPTPLGGFDLLAEIRLESVEAGPVRLQGQEGPMLELMALPYAL
jgi:folate-binding protein YgfZ